MQNNIHLVLISAQAVPNITPILDERSKPNQVIMLVSPDMQNRAEQLESIYKPRGIKVGYWPIQDAWDIEHIRNRVMELLIKYEDDAITLNATGGTKPMSIAAYEVFRSFEKSIFYIHPEQDRLIWMYPQDKPAFDLVDRIKLKEYLIAYGATHVNEVHKGGVSQALRHLSGELIERITHYSDALSTLNYFAAMADKNRLLSPELDGDLNRNYIFWDLVERFQQAGLLQQEDNRLRFNNEEDRFMVNGGWLEMHAYAICLNLKKQLGIQDVARSIEVKRQQGKSEVLNEIDVGFLQNNRLFLLECKTKVYSGHNRKHDEGAEVLYKLDSLRDLLGGLQAQAMLVSVKKLKKHNLSRAKELQIQYCGHEDLKFLEQKIADWLQK